MKGRSLLLALPLAACGDVAVLAPQGPHAQRIAELSWTLLGMVGVVMIVVLLALVLALRGSASIRKHLARDSMIVAAGIAFPVVVLCGLLTYGVWLTRTLMPAASAGDVVHIRVIGEQWWWRVAYRDRNGSEIATANEITIPVGRTIQLELQSADVIHSFWVPRLGGKLDMIPGRTTRLQLRADSEGVFRGQCAEYCGGPHALMALEVVALAPEQFEDWLAREAQPAAEPVSADGRQGRDIFFAAGCGSCHAVRGSEASGTIGPDLTHLGARRSLGANLLPLSADNLQRFIADGQHLKPGNLMPPFRVFSADERTALAAYLMELR